MEKKSNQLRKLIFAALCLALALVLPMITANIREIGNMLCPMHFPVFICGFICGWQYGMVVGFIAPLLRFAIFGMPPIMPMGLSMACELATYGLVVALLHSRLPHKKSSIYVSLLLAMVAGRIIWGIARFFFTEMMGVDFPFSAFIAGAITTAIPGIVLQIILIPIIVMALEKAKVIE